MEKGRGKGTDTLQTDNVFTSKGYIEREAAIDALQNHYEVRNAVQNGIMDECVMLMMRVPAADVVEVVRCKDCKHSKPWYADKSICFLWHESGIDVFNDGFCSYGALMDKDGDGE